MLNVLISLLSRLLFKFLVRSCVKDGNSICYKNTIDIFQFLFNTNALEGNSTLFCVKKEVKNRDYKCIFMRMLMFLIKVEIQ